jgi:hypothetical protein
MIGVQSLLFNEFATGRMKSEAKAMKFRLGILLLSVTLAAIGFADTPHLVNTNGNISIDVEDMKAGEFLRLWDQTTRMHSRIPPALADRTFTIHFDGLPVDKALQRIFEKLKFDYVFVKGQGVAVTGVSQAGAVEPGSIQSVSEIVSETPTPTATAPANQPKLAVEARLPPLIATPFGPIPDTGNPVTFLPPIPTAPPPIPFFAPPQPAAYATPPWSGPIPENMFRPISIYPDPNLARR